VSTTHEPEGWQAECWSALYEPAMLVGVPVMMAFIHGLLWVELAFICHNLIFIPIWFLSHWGLKKLHDKDPERLAVVLRSAKFVRHMRV
jgi:type IV secretory pathway TrbD component